MKKRALKIALFYKGFSDRQYKIEEKQNDLIDFFNYDSKGIGIFNENNPYMLGKSLFDLTVKQWKEDLNNDTLFLHEILNDENYKENLDVICKALNIEHKQIAIKTSKDIIVFNNFILK